MDSPFSISGYLEAHRLLACKIDHEALQKSIKMIQTAFDSNKKIITCGNGGSASTASHYITDWNKMVYLSTGRKFRGVSLCDNIGLVTAYGNDQCFENIYSGQLASIADDGDLLIAISGSGNSANVIKAVEYANKNGVHTLGVLGYDGGKLMPVVHQAILVPSFDMQLCEDFHLMFGHMVMKSLCGYAIKN